jgi:WD40 repeat protein
MRMKSEIGSSAALRYALPEAWTTRIDEYVTALSAASDGTAVAAATGDGHVLLVDAESGEVRLDIPAHRGEVLALDWSPADRILATGGQDGTLRLHSATGEAIGTFAGNACVEHVRWSPGGRWLAAACGNSVKIWSASGKLELETQPHENTVTGLAWSPSGAEFATACGAGVRLFQPGARAAVRHLCAERALVSLAWSPNGGVIACATEQNSVHLWWLPSGRAAEIRDFVSPPRAMAWDSRGTLLVTGGSSTATLWSFEPRGPKEQAPKRLAGHQALCTALAFQPNKDRLVSGGDDAAVLVWEPRTRTNPLAFGCLEDTVTALVWTRGRRFVAVDAMGTLRAWRVE